jgi:hypothetical protein
VFYPDYTTRVLTDRTPLREYGIKRRARCSRYFVFSTDQNNAQIPGCLQTDDLMRGRAAKINPEASGYVYRNRDARREHANDAVCSIACMQIRVIYEQSALFPLQFLPPLSTSRWTPLWYSLPERCRRSRTMTTAHGSRCLDGARSGWPMFLSRLPFGLVDCFYRTKQLIPCLCQQ